MSAWNSCARADWQDDCTWRLGAKRVGLLRTTANGAYAPVTTGLSYQIDDGVLLVLVVGVGHRREIYNPPIAPGVLAA